MSSQQNLPQLIPFDAARYLIDEAAIAEYVDTIAETGDIELVLLALDDLVRAQGLPKPN